MLLVSGHYGNWEAGGVLLSRRLHLPLTVVAMREASPTVNRIRQQVCVARLGIETIEVRQSLDTPLQIRAALAQNRFVALLVDRHLGRDRVPVTFLGRRCAVSSHAFRDGRSHRSTARRLLDRARTERNAFVRTLALKSRSRPASIATSSIRRLRRQVADELTELVRDGPECWYQFYRYWDAQSDNYTGLIEG